MDARLRDQGLTRGLLEAAVRYARSMGAEVVEGCPGLSGEKLYPYMGVTSTSEQAGFRDVTPPQNPRRIYRTPGG